MTELLKTLSFGEILSWSLTIFSTVFGIYTWVIGKSRKELSVSCETNEIIIAGKRNIEKLSIQYDGCPIQDLSSSRFYIWNSGNSVINKSDVVSDRPICVHNTGKASILNAQIVRVNENSNAFLIEQTTDKEVKISFDYVDHGEGFVLQILHSGSSKDLELDCKIKGGKEIRERSGVRRKKKEFWADRFVDVLFAYLPALLGYASVFLAMGILIHYHEQIADNIETPTVLVSCIASVLIGATIGNKIGSYVNSKFHRTIPKTLKDVKDEKETTEKNYA